MARTCLPAGRYVNQAEANHLSLAGWPRRSDRVATVIGGTNASFGRERSVADETSHFCCEIVRCARNDEKMELLDGLGQGYPPPAGRRVKKLLAEPAHSIKVTSKSSARLLKMLKTTFRYLITILVIFSPFSQFAR